MASQEFFSSWFAVCLLFSGVTAQARGNEVVTATQFNGIWTSSFVKKERDGSISGLGRDFSILALSNQRLRVVFAGAKYYKDPGGTQTANTGDASGIAVISQNTAVLKPDGEDDCLITLTLKSPRLLVQQAGCLGSFGNGVSAGGTYKRTSRRVPKFDQ